jgi:superfamily II DNA/RNA helicase
LKRHGFSAGELHGDMDQKSRMETLDAFKTNKLTLLVASDVAARGLDIPAVSHVFNFDVPTHAEDYIHRIGRTGRAGRSGTSLTLSAPSDGKYLDAIQRLIQQDIPLMVVEGQSLADESPRGDAPRSESRSRGRSRHTGDGKATRPTPETVESPLPREKQNAHPPRSQQEPRAPREKTEPRSQREKNERRPRNDRGVNNPERVAEYASDTPFGSDGPVPAFLLRPGVGR